MDRAVESNPNTSVSALCNAFSNQKDLLIKLHTIFVHGLSHVTLSLRKHLDSQ